MNTRLAGLADAEAISSIYNRAIDERIATFETVSRSRDEIENALRGKAGRFPVVVAEQEDVVIGFAWVSVYRPRAAYAGVGEHSVYVSEGHRGRGVGAVLIDALIEECRRGGFWKLVSRIFPENEASLALHRAAGFRVVGVYERHARLDGQWKDTVIVERLIDDEATDDDRSSTG